MFIFRCIHLKQIESMSGRWTQPNWKEFLQSPFLVPWTQVRSNYVFYYLSYITYGTFVRSMDLKEITFKKGSSARKLLMIFLANSCLPKKLANQPWRQNYHIPIDIWIHRSRWRGVLLRCSSNQNLASRLSLSRRGSQSLGLDEEILCQNADRRWEF